MVSSPKLSGRRAPPAAAIPPPAPQAAAPSPLVCATAVLDAVPAAMDGIRAAMRLHVGGQMSVPQFRCLAFVARDPGTSIGAVAAFLGVTMPTASAMVDRLMRAGEVASRVSSQDRRRLELELTPAGQAHLRRIRRDARAELAQALSTCNDTDRQQLCQGLDVLQRVFGPQR